MAKDPTKRVEIDLRAARYRVGRTIASIREWRNLTQEHLEGASGIDVTRISRIERGRVNPGIDTYIRIAAALHVPLFWLFTDDWPAFVASDATALAPPDAP